jgi:transposase
MPTLFLCREPAMPKYKNPLYNQTSQYLKGAYAADLSAHELHELENNLITLMKYKIQMIDLQVSQIVDRIDLVEEKKTAIRKNMDDRSWYMDKNYRALDKHYLALLKLICRLTRSQCRLIRTQYQITNKMNKRNDLDLFAFEQSPPPAGGIDTLLPVFIRSSQKTKFFYSKLFRKNMDLTDDQWNAVKNILPQKVMQGAGRPPQSTRDVLNGILWKLRTAASWNDLPHEYPSHQTCYRYYTQWVKTDILDSVIQALIQHLNQNNFSLSTSLDNGDIELVEMAKQTYIRFAPRLQDTWQASTALLILQIFISKKRKQGESVRNISQAYPLTD